MISTELVRSVGNGGGTPGEAPALEAELGGGPPPRAVHVFVRPDLAPLRDQDRPEDERGDESEQREDGERRERVPAVPEAREGPAVREEEAAARGAWPEPHSHTIF